MAIMLIVMMKMMLIYGDHDNNDNYENNNDKDYNGNDKSHNDYGQTLYHYNISLYIDLWMDFRYWFWIVN